MKNIMKAKRLVIWILSLTFMPVTAVADAYDANNYLPTNANVTLNETNLPILFINTTALTGNTTVIHKDYRVAVRMTIISNADGKNYADTVAHPNQKIDYDGWVAIKYRGNSSFEYAKKKPLGFKTMATSDVDGKKEKVKLLGMPKDNDWVLLAPYHDRSMIRDVLTFELARPYFEYTPRSRHCELIMDGVYRGVYILCEKPGKGKNRLNLEEPGDEGDAVTGDYLIEVDGNDEEHYYTSKYKARDANGKDIYLHSNVYIQYKAPDYDDMMPDHPAQLEYINQHISDMEDALNGPGFASPQTGYRHYFDVSSIVNFMLTQEFTGNPDAYRRSTYLYKRRDSVDPRFKMCLWDFNMAYGNSLQGYLGENKWHYINESSIQAFRHNHVPFWWTRMMSDPYYVDRLKRRWGEFRTSGFREARITQVIDSLVNLLEIGGARERNYQAWPNWNEYVYLAANNTRNYEEEIATLRSWIDSHLSWLDQQLGFDPQSQTTGILSCTLNADGNEAGSEWYDLQGRRIDGLPAKKGVYVHGGRKVVVR